MTHVGRHRAAEPSRRSVLACSVACAVPPVGLARHGVLLGSVGLGAAAPTAQATTRQTTQPAALAPIDDLWKKIHAIDASTTGMLQVVLHDSVSGKWLHYNNPPRNECASIVKVLILATVCQRAQAAGRALTAWERSQAAAMIRYSDNTSASNLFRSVGGAPALQAMARRLGMTQTVASSAWGLTRSSAYDQVLLMDELAYRGRVLSATNRQYILGLMGTVTASQRWGVGSYGTAQVKNGWLPYGGAWRINSIGRVTGSGRNYTLAIMQKLPTMASGTSVANRVASAVYQQLAKPL